MGSLLPIFAQMRMITQFFGSKERRVINQKWNTGGLLLKCPDAIAVGISVFLSAADFSKADAWGGAKSQKTFYEIYQLEVKSAWVEKNRCSDKTLRAGKGTVAKQLYNTPFMMEKADSELYSRSCHGLYLFSFPWLSHKDDVGSAERKVRKQRPQIYSLRWGQWDSYVWMLLTSARRSPQGFGASRLADGFLC